jgi:hypothetical protein
LRGHKLIECLPGGKESAKSASTKYSFLSASNTADPNPWVAFKTPTVTETAPSFLAG